MVELGLGSSFPLLTLPKLKRGMKLFFLCLSLQIILSCTQHSILKSISPGLALLLLELLQGSDKLFPKELSLIIGSSPNPEIQLMVLFFFLVTQFLSVRMHLPSPTLLMQTSLKSFFQFKATFLLLRSKYVDSCQQYTLLTKDILFFFLIHNLKPSA